MNTFRTLLSILLVLACAQFRAQTLTVLDAESGLPLDQVILLGDSARQMVLTNEAGQADLSLLQGSTLVELRAAGYATQVRSYATLLEIRRVRLETSNLNLSEVVISASRWRQVSDAVPARVVSINPQMVALQNSQTAADMLGSSGKVFIQKSQQGGGSPMIRGFATNRLLYTVDGVRMNNAIFRGGNIQNVINIDPFALERTEVLFGASSVMYGSDAIGGVMSFHTLPPQLSLSDTALVSGKAVLRYASANKEQTGHFDLHLGWRKWASVTSFSTWRYGPLRQGRHGPDDYLKPFHVQRQDSTDVVVTQQDPLLQIPSGYDQINWMQKIRYKPSENWNFQYGFHFSETSSYGRYDRHNRQREGAPRYGRWDYGPQMWLMHNLLAEHQGGGALYDQANLRLAQQSFAESRITRNFNNEWEQNRRENVDAYSLNLDMAKKMGKHQWYYGLEAVHNEVFSRGSERRWVGASPQQPIWPGSSRYPRASWSSYALYVNDSWALRPGMTLQGGLRYNHFALQADFSNNQEFFPLPSQDTRLRESALTGSLGLVKHNEQNWVYSLNLATAFRAPNVDDIGKVFDSEPGAVVVPNPDLNAEYAYNLDIGLARVWAGQFKLDMSLYYTWLNGAMVRRDFSLAGQDSILYDGQMSRVQAVQNAAQAQVYGVQMGLEWQLPAGFSLAHDLNWQEGWEEQADGQRSPARHAAPLFGTLRLSYRKGALQWQLYGQYQGRRRHGQLALSERNKTEIYALDARGQTFAPSWYTVNYKVRYILSPGWSVSAGLENITDRRYRPYSSGLSGAGRNFILAFQARF